MAEYAVTILTSLEICKKLRCIPTQGCTWCHSLETPLWRKDKVYPHIILCNRCGLRSNKGQKQWHYIMYHIKV